MDGRVDDRKVLTGLLLGAGASRELGMPLVTHLTAKLRAAVTVDRLHTMNAARRQQGTAFSQQAVDDLAELLAGDLSYEAMLGWLETQGRRPENYSISQDYHGLRVWLSDLVYFVFNDLHRRGIRRIEANIKHFQGLAVLAKQNSPFWVFNLNHDLMVECIAAVHGLPISCGFTDEVVALPRTSPTGTPLGVLAANVLRRAMIEKGQAEFFRHGADGVNLLKLHGSLDVFTFNDGKDMLLTVPQNRHSPAFPAYPATAC